MIAKRVRQFIKRITSHEYLRWCLLEARVGKLNRYTESKIRVHGLSLIVPDTASFLSAYKEIFVNSVYAFDFNSPSPRILDLGANIGLSVLFFKRMYPKSIITAFEADPYIFKYLRKNIIGNGYSDVTIVNRAIWDEHTTLRFQSDKADGGRVICSDNGGIQVEAIDIGEYLKSHPVDFLKMDIEGAEEVVLPACREHLRGISYLFVEYHSQVGKKQVLADIIHIMTEAGFRVHLHPPVIYNPAPFLAVRPHCGFDLQMNIFGWRE